MNNAAVSTTAPPQLSDRELAVLESTLRVQLQVSKYTGVAQVARAALSSGAFAAVSSGVSIVTSQAQRRKLKKRHREVVMEMHARGETACVSSGEAQQLGKKAYAISMATGLACCLLAFSADLLIDRAVVQVVSEALVNYAGDFAVGTLAGCVTAQAMNTPGKTVPVASAAPETSQPPHPLKATRSWSAFGSKWKTPWVRKRTESLPPDLFGTLDEINAKANATTTAESPQVEVHRTNDYALFGECLVLEFTTPSPRDETFVSQGESTISQPLRPTIVGEDGALSETQWRSLFAWGENAGDEEGEEKNDDDDEWDLFGVAKVHDYNLFGVADQGKQHEACDLFGLTPTSSA